MKLSADNAIDDIQERDRIIIDSLNEQLEKMTNSINEQFALIESEDQFQVFYIKVGNSTFPYILDKHTGKTKPAFNQ